MTGLDQPVDQLARGPLERDRQLARRCQGGQAPGQLGEAGGAVRHLEPQHHDTGRIDHGDRVVTAPLPTTIFFPSRLGLD